MTDRIKFDTDADGYELDTIDELVLHGASIHLEMSSHTSGWMSVWTGYRADDGQDEELRFVLRADPVSRTERARRLKAEQDRLIDHLRSLLPWGGSMWAVPIRRRPAAAVRDWWTARRYAGVRLTVREES